MKKKTPLISKVKFFKNSIFSHQDSRRSLIGLAGNLKFVNDSKQIKIINVTKKSVKNEIIGNHRHIRRSNQWEYIYVLHKNTKKKIFEFRYKNYDEPIKKKILFAGDCVSVPPGCALGLLPLVEDSILIEISNKIYHDNYEKINLFA